MNNIHSIPHRIEVELGLVKGIQHELSKNYFLRISVMRRALRLDDPPRFTTLHYLTPLNLPECTYCTADILQGSLQTVRSTSTYFSLLLIKLQNLASSLKSKYEDSLLMEF